MVKTQEKTDLSHDELPLSNKYLEYDNRPVGPNNSNNLNLNKELDRNERPIGGIKNIDYNAMFGEGGEFDGDPFGGAKQTDKNNKKERNKLIHNNHNNNLTKKKPVYDARKAIEEAKLKEAKEGKKEKPSAFREFLREMKKISAEEKTQHNETINNNIDINNNNPKINKRNKNNKNKEKEITIDLDNKGKYKDNKLLTEIEEEN